MGLVTVIVQQGLDSYGICPGCGSAQMKGVDDGKGAVHSQNALISIDAWKFQI
jgi:hypothetical protein